MRVLILAFLVLWSYCDALTLPGGIYDISSASPNGFVAIFPQSRSVFFVLNPLFPELWLTSMGRALALLNTSTLFNSTEPALGLPVIPSLHQDLKIQCGTDAGAPFKGGRLMYSLLTELSGLWKSTDNPILREPWHVRNLPFYSIEIAIVPFPRTQILLNREKMAVYLAILVRWVISKARDSGWPGQLKCNLMENPQSLLIGTMDVNRLSITTLEPGLNSTGLNISSTTCVAGTACEVGGSVNVGADDIDVHLIFTATKVRNRTVLHLLTSFLLQLFNLSTDLVVTTILPPVRTSPNPSHPFSTYTGELMLNTRAPLGNSFKHHQIWRLYSPVQNAP
jgi:hypothetical protein